MKAISNRIVIGSDDDPIIEFDNAHIKSVESQTAVSLIGDELFIDQFLPVVDYEVWIPYVLRSTEGNNVHLRLRSSDGKVLTSCQNYDLRQLPYGTRIMYYSDDRAVGEFFCKKVERTGMREYKISAMSAIGLMDKQIHKGGIYRGATFADVVREIVGAEYDEYYTIDGVVATQRVYGWLPYSTRRKNLHQLIMAYGVTIRRTETGIMHFVFLEDEVPTEIPSSRVFGGGSVVYNDPASRIEVTEHSYHYVAEVDEEVLFDNTSDEAADHVLITFDQPIYVDSVRVEDGGNITIHQIGVNYAYVSGMGIIYGKPYTHTAKILSMDNENAQKEKVVRVEEATLITLQNSANVMERLAQYYFHATTVKQDIILEDEKAGGRYEMLNAFREELNGFISRMDIRTTSFRRASCEIVQNYTPIGHGSSYENSLVIPLNTGAEQTWTVPQSVKDQEVPTVRVVLIGFGFDGADGASGGKSTQSTSKAAVGGVGGNGGRGGDGGKVLIVNLDVSEISQLTVYNSGKDSKLVAGQYTYSSGDGASMRYGYYDPFEDKSYAIRGEDGIRGGDGGMGDFWTHAQSDMPHSDAVTKGQDVEHDGVTYTGGNYSDRKMMKGEDGGIDPSVYVYVAASSGGGAAVGANGGNAPAKTTSNFNQSIKGGVGANAANADPTAEIYGAGGNGGHGGGGGGTGSMQDWYNIVYKSSNAIYAGPSMSGGTGGRGGAGYYGCAIIYY